MLRTPILFLIFNRPDVTFRVFEEIRKAKPEQLFIAADGPREDKQGETEKCEQARSIVNKVDWPCEVKTLFRSKNMGCRDAVSSAINWFFENVEEGIILEDDCLPDPSFFAFCQTLLEKYRETEQVMHIGGNNHQNGKYKTSASYYFSKYAHIWGWATWRRAWKRYDVRMSDLGNVQKSASFKSYILNNEHLYWLEIFIQTQKGKIDTWDYQWQYSVWKSNGIAIIPNENLVTNIGFNEDATHTKESSPFANMKVTGIGTNLIHPETIQRNTVADENYFNLYLRNRIKHPKKKTIKSETYRVFNKIKKLFTD